MADQGQNLPMSVEDLASWWTSIELARARRKREEDVWQVLLDAYLPPPNASADTINSNVHFRNTESKKAKLFAQLPELQLTPDEKIEGLVDPATGQPMTLDDVIATKRAMLNKLLGRRHAKLLDTIDDVLFDALQTSGIAASKICYEADFQPMPRQVPDGEALMPGSVLGLQPVPKMKTEIVNVPIYERYRWYRFSPSMLLIPHDWRSTRFDDAPWLGMEFNLPLKEAIRRGLVPEGAAGNATTDDTHLKQRNDNNTDTSGPRIKGVEIWCHAVQFREGVYHSELFDYLVLIDGDKEKPAKYSASPYQTLGPDGRLTPDSMIGNPIHPCSLRTLTDTAWVPSDAAFTNPLVKQKNTWRSQDIKLRDSNIARFFYAESIKDQVDALAQVDAGQGVPVPDDKLAVGADKLIAPIPHLERAQADIQGEASISRDIDDTLAIGSNQGGNVNSKVLSATEIATAQTASNSRLHKEQLRFINSWFLPGVQKFDSLVMRFADTVEYVEIVGVDGAKRLQAYNKTLALGRYSYDAKPDSQLQADAAADRENALKFVNFTAKSPFIDQMAEMRWLASKFGVDPSIVKAPPAPPEEKPSVSYSIKIEDFYGPGAEVARQLAEQSGFKVTPEAIAAAKTIGAMFAAAEAAKTGTQQPDPGAPKNLVHGGTIDKADVLSKHSADETGNMPGRTPEGAPPQQTSGMVQ